MLPLADKSMCALHVITAVVRDAATVNAKAQGRISSSPSDSIEVEEFPKCTGHRAALPCPRRRQWAGAWPGDSFAKEYSALAGPTFAGV